jgi:hypothetical protein
MVMKKRLFQWCPIFVEPIPGSGEKIVLAIAVCDANHDAVVEAVASAGDLPDGWLRTSMEAIGPLLRAFETTLIEHGASALTSEAVLSHGVYLGTVRRAFGIDARQVARSISKITASLSDILQKLTEQQNLRINLNQTKILLNDLMSQSLPNSSANDDKEKDYYKRLAGE